MYEANISPNSSYSSDFYTIKDCDSLQNFLEVVKEELSQFDPDDEPCAIIIKYVEFPWYGEKPILKITYTQNFGFIIEDIREN